jgi:hypothetical protein
LGIAFEASDASGLGLGEGREWNDEENRNAESDEAPFHNSHDAEV